MAGSEAVRTQHIVLFLPTVPREHHRTSYMPSPFSQFRPVGGVRYCSCLGEQKTDSLFKVSLHLVINTGRLCEDCLQVKNKQKKK